MPIEFPCSGCQRLLRTADDTAGKQAQCPECGQIQTVPSANAPASVASDSAGAGSPGVGSFETAAGGPAANPNRAPAFDPSSTEMGFAAGEGTLQPTPIEFGETLSRTWERFSAQLGTCVLFGFAWLLFAFACCVGLGFISTVAGEPVVGMVFQLAALLLWSFLNCMMVLFALNLLRKHPSPLWSMWKVGPRFLRVLLFNFLWLVALLIASSVCEALANVVPPTPEIAIKLFFQLVIIICNLLVFLAVFFIIDQGNGVLESVWNSIRHMHGNKLTAFAIMLVVGGLTALIVLLTCGLALILVSPYYALLMAVIYLSATGQWRAELPGSSENLSQTGI